MSLSSVEIEHFPNKNVHGLLIPERVALFQRQEVRIVGRVDGGGNAKNRMRDGDSTTKSWIILDIIDHERRIMQIADYRFDRSQDIKFRVRIDL